MFIVPMRLLTLAALTAITASATATPIVATAVLNSTQERAAGVDSTSPALGAAVLTVEPTTGEFNFSLEVTGISPSDLADLGLGPAISSIHLHNAPAGQNGPVVVDLGGGNTNANVEVFGNGGFTNRISGFFGGVVGPTLADSNLNLARLLTEDLYINVHTNEFLGGAIRGQLSIVQQPIPEPGAVALVALGSVTVMLGRRNRRA